jgi:single-stranded-DNA-specific exonuclease
MHNWVPLDYPLEQHPKHHYISYYSRQFLIDPILGHYFFLHEINDEEKLEPIYLPFRSGYRTKSCTSLYHSAKRKLDLEFHGYLEVAILRTIADLMPIINENRVICKTGLRKMNFNPHPVFKRIFEKSFVKFVDSSTVGFTLGPIFNSCGRIDNPNRAIEILTSEEFQESQIDSLINLNEKR